MKLLAFGGLISLLTFASYLFGNSLLVAPVADADNLNTCNEVVHDSSQISSVAVMYHTYGTFKGKVRGTPSILYCDDTMFSASNVVNVRVQSRVYEDDGGGFSQCAYTDAGWRGANPGSGEWYTTWNYYDMQDCVEPRDRYGKSIGTGKFSDGHYVTSTATGDVHA